MIFNPKYFSLIKLDRCCETSVICQMSQDFICHQSERKERTGQDGHYYQGRRQNTWWARATLELWELRGQWSLWTNERPVSSLVITLDQSEARNLRGEWAQVLWRDGLSEAINWKLCYSSLKRKLKRQETFQGWEERMCENLYIVDFVTLWRKGQKVPCILKKIAKYNFFDLFSVEFYWIFWLFKIIFFLKRS